MDIISIKTDTLIAFFISGLTYFAKYKEINLFIIKFFSKAYAKYKSRSIAKQYLRLDRHPIFEELDICIKYKIPQVKYICKIRKELFTFILSTKLKVLKEELLKLSANDVTMLNSLSKGELFIKFEELLTIVNQESHQRWENKGVFEFVINQYVAETKSTEELFLKFINRVVLSDRAGVSNVEKIHTIFLSLSVLYVSLLLDMEETFTKINGGLSDKAFNGIQCIGYEHCGLCRKHLTGA